MKKIPTISMDEVFAEMEKLRKTNHYIQLTNDQKEFLRRGRAGQQIVCYPALVTLWQKAGWGKVTPEFLRNQYVKLKSGE